MTKYKAFPKSGMMIITKLFRLSRYYHQKTAVPP